MSTINAFETTAQRSGRCLYSRDFSREPRNVALWPSRPWSRGLLRRGHTEGDWALTRRALPRRGGGLDRRNDGRGPRIGVSSVQRIWRTTACNRVEPTRNSPPSCPILSGSNVDPPAHVVVLSVYDERAIQTFDRTQPV